jgi:hypothetical protein
MGSRLHVSVKYVMIAFGNKERGILFGSSTNAVVLGTEKNDVKFEYFTSESCFTVFIFPSP